MRLVLEQTAEPPSDSSRPRVTAVDTWPDGPGVVVLPDGRRVRARGLRHPLPQGLQPQLGVYLVAADPGPFPWEHHWVRCPDFRTPSSTDDAIAALVDAHERAATERVEVACGGGVGRTGMALSMLATWRACHRPTPWPGSASTATTGRSRAPATTEPRPSPSTTSAPPTSPTTATTVPSRRTPTAAAPLRLLIAGDSMTEATGPALLDSSDATGVIQATRELRYSSGLTRPDYFDWPAALGRLIDEQDPEVVVIMLGANDAQGIQTPAGPASFGSEAWIAEYRSRVAATMALLEGADRTVYWVGLPVMRSGDFDERMRLITHIYRAEAAQHRGVRFIDTRALFADAAGSYAAYLPGTDGNLVLVRREDGIHLTPAGAERLARSLMDAIAQDWDLGD